MSICVCNDPWATPLSPYYTLPNPPSAVAKPSVTGTNRVSWSHMGRERTIFLPRLCKCILPFASPPPPVLPPSLIISKKGPEHTVGRNILLLSHSPFSASCVFLRAWPDCSTALMTMMHDCRAPRLANYKECHFHPKDWWDGSSQWQNNHFFFPSPARCIKEILSNCSTLCTKNEGTEKQLDVFAFKIF